MSDVLTHRDRPRHPEFDHVALFHDGPHDLGVKLAGDLAGAVDAGEAVLVCCSEPAWTTLSREVGRATADRVTFVPDGVRCERPAVAMRMLHNLVRDRVRSGAGAVWSIGTIPFRHEPAADLAWVRYEAAVSDVLRDLPLHAICPYDVALTPRELLDAARRTHLSAHDEHGARLLRSETPDAVRVPAIPPPPTAPTLHCAVSSPGEARRAIAAVYGTSIDAEALDGLLTVTSELVTNALLYGGGHAVVAAWFDRDTATTVLEVCDPGDGIVDPYFELRPPRAMPGGAGLWIVGQLSECVTSHRAGEWHHVTATLRHRSPAWPHASS